MATTNLTLLADDGGSLTGPEADGRVDYSFSLASVPTGSFVRFSFQVSNVQMVEDVDLQVVIGGQAYKLIDVTGNNSYIVDIPASQLQVGANTVRLVALAPNTNGFNVNAVSAVFTTTNQDPTAPATNAVTTAEDTASAAVAIGAADLDGDTLSYSIKAGAEPQHGSVSFADGKFTYTPSADYNGADSFTILVSDGKGGTTEQVVSVTVDPVNDAPVAVADSGATAEDLAVTFTAADLLGNDSDIDNASLSITAVGAAQNGTVVLNDDGTVTFTPDADYSGPTSFEYTVSDGTLTDTGTVNLTVSAVNDAPIAAPVTLTAIAEDSGARLITQAELLAGADDVDSSLTVTALAIAGGGGALVDNGDGTWTYTPAANDDGAVTFDYTVSDGALSATSTASLDFTAVNDTPVANTGTDAGDEDGGAIVGQVTASDIDGDALAYSLVNGPTAEQGELTFGEDGQYSFTSAQDFNGIVTFSYRAYDGAAYSAPATVTITVNAVNDVPVADASQSVATNEDAAKAVTVTASDVDGDALTFAAGAASHGIVAANGDGGFTYTPDANYFGSDSFEVTISDGNGGSTTQVVNVTVNPVNDAPEAPAANSVTTDEDIASAAVAIGATDVDSPLSYDVKSGAGPSRGTVSFDATAGTFTYTPTLNENGSDSFTILISDGEATIEQAVSVTVNAINDAPVATDGANAGYEDGAINGTVPTATDVDNANLSYALVSGAVDTNGQPVSGLQFNDDGSYSFQGPPHFNGRVTFTYAANDGELTSNVATMTLDIASVNDAPSGADKTVTTAEDTPHVFTAADFGFSDPDGNSFAAVKITAAPATGALLLDGVAIAAGTRVVRADIDAGKLTFAPAPNANNGSNSSYASFAFQVQDDGGTADGGVDTSGSSNSLTISVTPVNDNPDAANDSFGTGIAKVYEGSEFAIEISDLLANDSDLDGDLVQFVQHFQPSQYGTVAKVTDLNGASYLTFNYTGPALAEGATQAVSFQYAVSDGQGGTDTATVSLLVTGLANKMIYGTNGVDTINGSNSARDTIDGLNGDDVINGYGGDDKLFGSNGIDRLFGGDGADMLDGGRGDDWLEGGRGNDVMSGGLGADLFVVGQNANGIVVNTGVDKVTDFKVGTDHIRLQAGVSLASSGGVSYADVDSDTVMDTVLKFDNGGSLHLLGVSNLPAAEVLFG